MAVEQIPFPLPNINIIGNIGHLASSLVHAHEVELFAQTLPLNGLDIAWLPNFFHNFVKDRQEGSKTFSELLYSQAALCHQIHYYTKRETKALSLTNCENRLQELYVLLQEQEKALTLCLSDIPNFANKLDQIDCAIRNWVKHLQAFERNARKNKAAMQSEVKMAFQQLVGDALVRLSQNPADNVMNIIQTIQTNSNMGILSQAGIKINALQEAAAEHMEAKIDHSFASDFAKGIAKIKAELAASKEELLKLQLFWSDIKKESSNTIKALEQKEDIKAKANDSQDILYRLVLRQSPSEWNNWERLGDNFMKAATEIATKGF